MSRRQSAALDRKKFLGDPILIIAVTVLIVFLALFVIYPLAILLVDSVIKDGHITGTIFSDVIHLQRFQVAFWNTLKAGILTALISTVIGLLFAYVDVYVRLHFKILEKLFNVVSLVINAAQRGAGNTKIAMRTNMVSNGVNIVFNYLLIGGNFGFRRTCRMSERLKRKYARA